MRQVWNAVQNFAQLCIRSFRCLLALFNLPAQVLGLFNLRASILLVLLQLGDFIRRVIALGF